MNRRRRFISSTLLALGTVGMLAAQPYDTLSRPALSDTVPAQPSGVDAVEPARPSVVASGRRGRHSGRTGMAQLDTMRNQVRRLRDEAEKLGRMAERLDEEADGVEDNVDALLEKADRLQEKLQAVGSLSDTARSGLSDSAEVAAVNRFLEKQKQMIGDLRLNAANLAAKSREMAVKVREMEHSAEQKEEEADSLDEAVQLLAEELDTEPYQLASPFQFGVQHRFFAGQFVSSPDMPLAVQGGLNFAYYPTPILCVGVKEMMAYARQVAADEYRVAIAATPTVAFCVFPIRSLQLGIDAGLALQGQVGAQQAAELAVIPQLSVFAESWFGRHFSFGPLFACHYVARGEAYVFAVPSTSENILPRRTWWTDGGVVFHYHF